LHLETRERVQTNEAKSKRRRAGVPVHSKEEEEEEERGLINDLKRAKGAFVPGGWYGVPCYTQSTTSTTELICSQPLLQAL